MAEGRTVGANNLTERDKAILKLCEEVSRIIESCITTEEKKKDFRDQYGKISYSRDAGAGRAGGKLQRDALCTRGVQGKEPISNRNLRWHPLVLTSNEKLPNATKVTGIEVDNKLIIITTEGNGRREESKPEETYQLKQRYFSVPTDWDKVKGELSKWETKDWTPNSCFIKAAEACEWFDAVEAFIALGLSIGSAKYGVRIKDAQTAISKLLGEQKIDSKYSFKTEEFFSSLKDLDLCPVCKTHLNGEDIEKFRIRTRGGSWQAPWGEKKRQEGNDSSIQLMHVDPLEEGVYLHKGANVRYGHRWW